MRIPGGKTNEEIAAELEVSAATLLRGRVHIGNVTRLEVGDSARNGADARRGCREPPLTALPVEYLTPAAEDRALEVQLLLADIGAPEKVAAVVAEAPTARSLPARYVFGVGPKLQRSPLLVVKCGQNVGTRRAAESMSNRPRARMRRGPPYEKFQGPERA
ncbi:MAG: hypothetical protein ACLP3C_05355 [Mycobacterium sp.]|uniref:hypothetical protein n=1 Tax=Mycobacterium sp. TaxID=1785 RepID=UPI003F9BEC84